MNETELIQNSTEAEIAAFESFQAKYFKMFPQPEKVSVTLKDLIGWQFWMAIIQGVFAIALAAMRTSDMFYKIAVSSSRFLATAEAIAAVGAIEGGIVVFASLRAEMQNRKTTGNAEEDRRLNLKASVWRLLMGEFLGLAVSIVAGLGLSFAGLGVPVQGFTQWLAIIVGAGASIIAGISGDVIGTLLSRLSTARDLAAQQYKIDQKEYENTMYARWEHSDERKIARGELKAAVRSAAVVAPRVRSGGRTHGGNGSNVVRESIFSLLDTFIAEHPDAQTIPGPTEISNTLNVAKSYASQVIHEWMDTKGFATEPVVNPNGHNLLN
jgi:hypothetical protein